MFKPMLADKVDLARLSLPVLASPKLDGIRCIKMPGMGVVSRNMKPIKNHWIRGKIEELGKTGWDGEIITYTNGQRDIYDTVNSRVMSADGMPDFVFHVFDDMNNPSVPYDARYGALDVQVSYHQRVEHQCIDTMEQLLAYERRCLDEGYEGVMIRDPHGPYKHGRSTTLEGWLLKMKRRIDSDATIVGFEEQMYNGNEATLDLLGRTERSSHKANLEPKGTLGALLCVWDNQEDAGASFNINFKIGTGKGMDAAKKQEIWNNQDKFLGRKVKFDYQGTGSNGRPRFPGWLGMRDDL